MNHRLTSSVGNDASGSEHMLMGVILHSVYDTGGYGAMMVMAMVMMVLMVLMVIEMMEMMIMTVMMVCS